MTIGRIMFSFLLVLVGVGASLATPVAAQPAGNAASANFAAPKPQSDPAAAPQPPVRVQLSSDKPLRVEQSGGGGTPGWLPAIITGLLTLAAVAWTNRQNTKNNRDALTASATNAKAAANQKANELEIAALEARLSEFYGPFLQLSEENKRLADLLRSRQGDGFRTLTALLGDTWAASAEATDKNLVAQIVENGVTLRQLIRDKAGPASRALQPYFARASAHFTILELAHKGELKGEPKKFADYVYPRQLDGVLDLERARLEKRRDMLRTRIAEEHSPIEDLVIPPDLALEAPAANTKAERKGRVGTA